MSNTLAQKFKRIVITLVGNITEVG